MTKTHIQTSIEDGVAIITLNDPDTLNAMTLELMGQLRDALDTSAADDQVRAIILTGSGRGFCSGQNLRALDAAVEGGIRETFEAHYLPAFKAIRGCPVPVVCAVNGVAAGGGFSLSVAADIVIAARSAQFIQVFSRIGLIPDVGSTFLLPRLIGRGRALYSMMTNDPISADTAKAWGLIWDCVDDDKLMDEALALARRLAEGPTRALVATRRAVDASEDHAFEEQFGYELEIQSELLDSKDGREGIQAFVEKRAAHFVGR